MAHYQLQPAPFYNSKTLFMICLMLQMDSVITPVSHEEME